MNTVKVNLNFCNSAIFYDPKNLGIIVQLNQVSKCIFNNFHEPIHISGLLLTLSIFDDVILNIHNDDVENIINNIHDLRENILYMLSFEKVVSEEDKNNLSN